MNFTRLHSHHRHECSLQLNAFSSVLPPAGNVSLRATAALTRYHMDGEPRPRNPQELSHGLCLLLHTFLMDRLGPTCCCGGPVWLHGGALMMMQPCAASSRCAASPFRKKSVWMSIKASHWPACLQQGPDWAWPSIQAIVWLREGNKSLYSISLLPSLLMEGSRPMGSPPSRQ